MHGQTGGWIRMPIGMDVGLGRGHIVLDGEPAPHGKGDSSPYFRNLRAQALQKSASV